jgi:hypothetical protein
MEVDESRRHDVAGHIEHVRASKRRFGYGSDLVLADPDMPDGIEIRRGIHHPSIREHQVEGLRTGVAGDKTGECQASEEAEDRCHADVIAGSVRRDNAAIEEDAQKDVSCSYAAPWTTFSQGRTRRN